MRAVEASANVAENSMYSTMESHRYLSRPHAEGESHVHLAVHAESFFKTLLLHQIAMRTMGNHVTLNHRHCSHIR